MPGPGSEPVELSLVHFYTSEGAYLVGDTGVRADAVWFPKALADVDLDAPHKMEWEVKDGERTGRAYPIRSFMVPERLAHEKGFL